MEIKLFEVRSAGTFYAVMAIWLSPRNEAERYLLQRSGYGTCDVETDQYVIAGPIDPSCGPNAGDMLHFSYSDFAWEGKHHDNLMAWLCDYLRERFSELESGQVIDYDFIHGRRESPRQSDRFLEVFP